VRAVQKCDLNFLFIEQILPLNASIFFFSMMDDVLEIDAFDILISHFRLLLNEIHFDLTSGAAINNINL